MSWIVLACCIVLYIFGLVCWYLGVRYSGENESDAFVWCLFWPILLVIYPFFMAIDWLHSTGQRFAKLGEKHRKGEKKF